MTAPSVGVIVPCYNYAHHLRACVASVLAQPGVDVRVLVIDDASSDNTAEVATALAAADPRVEFRRHADNAGHIATYNEGLAWSRADYTVLLSADDLLTPGALGRATALFGAHPNVGLVYGRPRTFATDAELPPARTEARGWRVWPGKEWVEGRCRDGFNVISSPEVVVRTDLVHRLGGYRSDLPHAGDLEMWLRFAAHADVGYVRGADQAYYRVHPSSMLRSRFSGALLDLEQRKAAFDALFRTHGDALPGAGRLAGMADRALAREALWRACRAYDRGRTTTDPVDELVAFAARTYPGAAQLREAWGLRWRRRVGAARAPWLQPLVLTAVWRRAHRWLWWESWKRTGVGA